MAREYASNTDLPGEGSTFIVTWTLDRPGCFDPWRLRAYFGSLGRRGTKLLERESGVRGQSMKIALEEALRRWVTEGKIREESGCYWLSR